MSKGQAEQQEEDGFDATFVGYQTIAGKKSVWT
jgi:hypothetical protein